MSNPPSALAGSHPPRLGLLALIVMLGLALRVAHLVALAPTAYVPFPLYASGTDMYHYWRSADVVLQGDWLGRHPYHALDNSPPQEQEKWLQRWGNPKVFHWEPLYPYALALFRAIDDSPLWVLAVQLLIGALTPVGVYVLGRQLANEWVALIAAAVTAVYGPLLCFQGAILRDGWQPLLEPWAWAALLWAGQRGKWWRWGLAGMAVGICVLNKTTAGVSLAAVLVWVLWRQWPAWRGILRHGAYWTAGVLVALSPLIARNIIVGAPPLAISNRVADTFVQAMAVDSDPYTFNMPTERQAILDRAHGSLLTTVRLTMATYQGDWGAVLLKLWRRLRAIVTPWEMPDNLAYSYVAGLSPVLRVMPGWWLLLPLGVTGLIWGGRDLRHPRTTLWIWLAVTGGPLLLLMQTGRYRLPLLPALALGVGLGVTFICDAWHARRWTRWGWSLGAILLAILLQWQILAVHIADYWWMSKARTMEYQTAARWYADQGEMDQALAEMARLQRAGPPRGNYPAFDKRVHDINILVREQYGWWLLHHNQVPQAYEQFAALPPMLEGDPARQQKIHALLEELRHLPGASATAPAPDMPPAPTTAP